MSVQLELFAVSENDQLRSELKKTREELSSVRKGLFSRHNEMLKMIVELRCELEELQKTINKEKVEDVN
jgi:hypothetical protein